MVGIEVDAGGYRSMGVGVGKEEKMNDGAAVLGQGLTILACNYSHSEPIKLLCLMLPHASQILFFEKNLQRHFIFFISMNV
jgi:hypothetical protein